MQCLSVQTERAAERSVNIISKQRMADRSHMDADLVSQHMIMCDGRLAAFADHGHFFSVFRASADRTRHGALIVRQIADHHAAIKPGDGMNAELLRDAAVCRVRLADDEHTAGVHVYAMDDTRTEDTVDSGKLRTAVSQQPVYQRAAPMAGSRMDDHILGFIDQMEIIAPGFGDDDNLLYAPEIKFYSLMLRLSKNCETNIFDLYGIGDGSGPTHGLMPASVNGVFLGRYLVSQI